MNSEIPTDMLMRITDAVCRHQKIKAITLYREATHWALADAKRAVESLERGLRAESPERFAPRSKTFVKLILVWHCIMVAGLTFVSVDTALRLARGEQLSLFRTWLPWVGLACSIFGAVSAFRAQWPKLAKP